MEYWYRRLCSWCQKSLRKCMSKNIRNLVWEATLAWKFLLILEVWLARKFRLQSCERQLHILIKQQMNDNTMTVRHRALKGRTGPVALQTKLARGHLEIQSLKFLSAIEVQAGKVVMERHSLRLFLL